MSIQLSLPRHKVVPLGKAGVQNNQLYNWIPACAGMTK